MLSSTLHSSCGCAYALCLFVERLQTPDAQCFVDRGRYQGCTHWVRRQARHFRTVTDEDHLHEPVVAPNLDYKSQKPRKKNFFSRTSGSRKNQDMPLTVYTNLLIIGDKAHGYQETLFYKKLTKPHKWSLWMEDKRNRRVWPLTITRSVKILYYPLILQISAKIVEIQRNNQAIGAFPN